MKLGRIGKKSEGLVRYIMVHLLSDTFPLYIINEHPKSGGTWIGQMMSKALDVPFPRNCYPDFASCIMHGHYINPWGMKNVVILWRDGRDVMVSWYFHCFFVNQIGGNKPIVEAMHKKFAFADYENVKENLPYFLEACFTGDSPIRFSWSEFVDRWVNREGVIYTKYENFRTSPVEELQKVIYQVSGEKISDQRATEIVDEFSFERQTGRKTGQQQKSNFLRKGIVGDWKNTFSSKSCEIFDKYAGEQLITLGYEKDHQWVNLV